jgi:hypothetical protein
MMKTTQKIKKQFVSLLAIALTLVLFMAFTNVNAQSSGKVTTTDPSMPVPTSGSQPAVLESAPAPDASDAMVIERKTAQPEPGTINANTIMPETPAAVKTQETAPAEQKKQTGKKQPK